MVYQTIPIELVEIADSADAYFREMGFTLAVEKTEVGFPRTPAFIAKRGGTTMIVEVLSRPSKSGCDDWSYYAKASPRDTRVAFCVPSGQRRFEEISARVRQNRMGLYLVDDDGAVAEVHPPHDLSVVIDLPPLAGLSVRLRQKLGPVYEKFNRGDWQEAFDDLCQVYEQDCKAYLMRKIAAGHINIVDTKGAIKNPTKLRQRKMTIGALAKAFSSIKFPTRGTAMVAAILDSINDDRIGVAHKKGKRVPEEKLKRNINGNIWRVVNGLRKFPN